MGKTRLKINKEIPEIRLDDWIKKHDFEIRKIMDLEEVSLNYTKEILDDFKRTIARMEQDLDYPLPMEDKQIIFEKRENLQASSYEEIIEEIKTYGKVISRAAVCDRLKDGTFLIRQGISEKGSYLPKHLVLEYLSHEFGHTLGNCIEDVLDEELKAYTFASLFFKYYNGKSLYSTFTNKQKEDIHRRALRELGKILRAGISEETIISHLIKEKFGKAKPTDLFKFLMN